MSGCWNFFLSCFEEVFILSIYDKAYCCTHILFPWHIVLNDELLFLATFNENLVVCEIRGSHNGGDKGTSLPVYDAIWKDLLL